MRQSGSSAARSAGFSVASSGIESKGTAGWIATPVDCIVCADMKSRLPVIVASVVAVVLIAYVAYRVVQSRQPEAPVLMKTSTAPPLRDPEETARQNVP